MDMPTASPVSLVPKVVNRWIQMGAAIIAMMAAPI